ncbi:MAG: bifunctional salicylyl-CoA 5-hydroxylase/oxidoreductase [Chloroflexota bacterium]|nr:bifunctional salicylyl-CoA 5-hydroxylase/oxidoreductase [Chloroflexota bacterium]
MPRSGGDASLTLVMFAWGPPRTPRVLIVGGGPGGLYLAILLKKARPECQIRVVERNPPDATFGFGVVFSDETLGYLQENDEPTFRDITATFARWDAIEVRRDGHDRVVSTGHGFSGIARTRLLEILQRRARELGVQLCFLHEHEPASSVDAFDLVVAADGVNSRTRQRFAGDFKPAIDVRPNRFAWFGTPLPFERFTFSFRETEHGLFWCHAYRYDAAHSTFIVECEPRTWAAAGLDYLSQEQSAALCERVFAQDLQGHPLLTNRSLWTSFGMLTCERWRCGNLVLLGDAAHTAHFSIGSGTKLAMEDAIALAYHLVRESDLEVALAAYEDERKPIVRRFQHAAYESLAWFEGVRRYMRFDARQFAFSLLTRSRRISLDNLRVRDPALVEAVHADFVRRSGAERAPDGRLPPPMFTPFQLRDVRLANRVVVSAMCMYSACDGTPNDWHLVHLGSRAVGGAGLVMTEMTDVSAEARISPGCAGMYSDLHQAAWQRIVDFVHTRTPARIGLQLGHAGRKASTRLMWQGDSLPLSEGNWPVISASPIPYYWFGQIPREMNRVDMNALVEDFVRAARRGAAAGFDLLELHMAHGYLLASFLSPLTNARTDAYGGSIENRMRFPLEVFEAARAVWPSERPMSVRVSATDWADGGITAADMVAFVRALGRLGCDIVDVSAGQTVYWQRPRYGRAFQTPFSDLLRNEAGMPTMTVGNITSPDEVNSILVAGRADLCVLARPHLRDPYWTLHAAAAQDWYAARWPPQYESVQPRPRESPVPPAPVQVRLDEDDPHGELAGLEQRMLQLARQHYRSLNGELVAALRAWVAAYPGVNVS